MIISYDGIASLCVSADEDQSHMRRPDTIALIKRRSEYPTGLGLLDFVGHFEPSHGVQSGADLHNRVRSSRLKYLIGFR